MSAFAFQGTNAHVVLAAAQPASSTSSSGGSVPGISSFSQLWRRRRCWYCLPPHAFHSMVQSPARPVVRLASMLQLARHAYLWDHRVRGRALFPGAAMYEAAYAAGMLLLDHTSQPAALLAESVIPTALVLRMSNEAHALCTTLDLPTGATRVSSQDGGARSTIHLNGGICQMKVYQAFALPPAPKQAARGVCLAVLVQPNLTRQPPHVSAAVSVSTDYQIGQYLAAHPAVADNATQTGGALAGPSRSSRVTSLPVGLTAYAGAVWNDMNPRC